MPNIFFPVGRTKITYFTLQASSTGPVGARKFVLSSRV